MTRKLLSSFVGVSGIFGTSIKFHALENPSKGIKNKNFLKRKNYLFKASREIGKNELKNISHSKNTRSLDSSHFGSWKYQSEGSSEDIYLVTKDNVVKKIEASNHGQKIRMLRDGILIDKSNTWFGKRDLSAQFNKKVSAKNKLEIIQEWKNNIQSSFDEEEMKLLGNWWASLEEYQQCEILEIFVDCDTIRRSLGGSGITWIDEGLKIKPEHLVYLGRVSNRNFPKLSEIIGSDKLIHLPKKGEIGLLAGEAIDNWVEEYVADKHIQKESQGEVNLISTVERIMQGGESYKSCLSSGKEEEKESKLYLECAGRIQEVKVKESPREGESVILPTIQGVVKAGIIHKNNDIRVSVANKHAKLWDEAGKEEDGQKSRQLASSLKSKGRSEGIIDIQCKQFEASWWDLIRVSSWGKQQGCEAAWKLIFPGEIDDKRLCLFNIPKAKYYLREYKISFLSLSNWYKNNKFWTKCSEYSI